MDYLSRSILATVCYADSLEYPLTVFDVWRYLMIPDTNISKQYKNSYSIGSVWNTLDTLVRDGRIICIDGFYTLPLRAQLVSVRKRRIVLSMQKLRAMSRSITILRYIPFVRQVWATGRLALKNANVTSDWDVLIVLRSRYIWTGRALVTAIVHLFGKRRHSGNRCDRLCLNYFVTTSSLKISIDEEGKLNEFAGKYEGLTLKEAREAILKDIESEGRLKKQEEIDQTVGSCWRCNTPVEYIVTNQWFINTLKHKKKLLEMEIGRASCRERV